MWKLSYSLVFVVFGLVSCSNTKIFPAQELDVLYSKTIYTTKTVWRCRAGQI